MYNEIAIIELVNDRKSRISLLLEFIESYAGWLEHLKGVGLMWGADGEERGANKEASKSRKHIEKLKKLVLKEINRNIIN